MSTFTGIRTISIQNLNKYSAVMVLVVTCFSTKKETTRYSNENAYYVNSLYIKYLSYEIHKKPHLIYVNNKHFDFLKANLSAGI